MKKLLFALGAMSLTAIASTSVVACAKDVEGELTNKKVKVDSSTINLTAGAAGTKNSAFLTDATLIAAVKAALAASSDAKIKAATEADYVISVEKPDVDQAAGDLQFTITGQGTLTGKATFTVTVKAA